MLKAHAQQFLKLSFEQFCAVNERRRCVSRRLRVRAHPYDVARLHQAGAGDAGHGAGEQRVGPVRMIPGPWTHDGRPELLLGGRGTKHHARAGEEGWEEVAQWDHDAPHAASAAIMW